MPRSDDPLDRRLALTALAALSVAAFAVRTVLVRGVVPVGERLALPGSDPWIHLRQIRMQVAHYPHAMTVDPLALHPAGGRVVTAPFFDFVVSTLAMVVGFGSPSETTIGWTAALVSPSLGALGCVVAYGLARPVAGRVGGLFSALVIAFVPTAFFLRSRLGFCDHHALEAVLAVLALVLLASAIGGRQGAASRSVAAATRRGLVAGVALGLYLLTWTGGALHIVGLCAFVLFQPALDRRAGRSPAPALAAVAASCLVAATSVLLWCGLLRGGVPGWARMQLLAIGGTVAVAGAAALAHRLRPGGRPIELIGATLGGGAALALVAWGIAPGVARRVGGAWAWLVPGARQRVVSEARPLLFDDTGFTLERAWESLGVALPLGLVGLAVLTIRVARGRAGGPAALAVAWSAVMLAAMLLQSRFGYYAAFACALGTACCVAPLLQGLSRRVDVAAWVRSGLWPMAAACVVVLPSLPYVLAVTERPRVPRASWLGALAWLRQNTPSPFEDPNAATTLYANRAVAPRSTYGILSWWDHGYRISVLGRRPPFTTATQARARAAARLLTMRDEDAAADACLAVGVRYVIVDGEMPILPLPGGGMDGHVDDMLVWAGEHVDPRPVIRALNQSGSPGERAMLFTPDYAQLLAVRLHLHADGARPDAEVGVARLRAGSGGLRLVGLESVASLAEARELAASDAELTVVTTDPLASCVELPPVRRFRRVFSSPELAIDHPLIQLPDVQIYEVLARE